MTLPSFVRLTFLVSLSTALVASCGGKSIDAAGDDAALHDDAGIHDAISHDAPLGDARPPDSAGDGGACDNRADAASCVACCDVAFPGAGAFPLYFADCCSTCPACLSTDPCSPNPTGATAACLACLGPKLGPGTSCGGSSQWNACVNSGTGFKCTDFVACIKSCPAR